jgi:hypothetical protein
MAPEEINSGYLNFVYDFYKTMKAKEIKIVYEGVITHQIIKAFIALSEAQMEQTGESARVQRIVFHVMVECLQNINKHADPVDNNESEKSRGIFLVSSQPDYFCITTGNIVFSDKIPDLKGALDKVNSMDRDALTELYKQQMKEGRITDKGGAGLGLIDMGRKTGNPLEYFFLDVSDACSFFVLTIRISRET